MRPTSSPTIPAHPAIVVDPQRDIQQYLDDAKQLGVQIRHVFLAEVPTDRRIAVHCAGGYRSSIAVSILNQYGITS